MSAQDRQKRQRRASEPAQAAPFPAGPAGKARKQAQGVSLPLPDSSLSLPARAAPGPDGTWAEGALRESEERFRGVFEASPWGLLIHDEGRILVANSTLAMIFGYEASELVGMDAPHLVAPEWRDFTLQKRIAGCEEPYEAVCLRRDGTIFPVQLCGSAVRSNGRVVRMVAVRDLTERERAEEARRQAEVRYRFLFEQAPAMYVITRNEESAPIISDCNELFLITLGYPRAEALGQSLAEFYTPASRVQLLEHGGYRRALEGRFGVEGRQLLARDGRVVETVLRAVPEFDDGGRTIGTRAMYLNITERKRVEEALRGSEERFRLIAQAASDGIWDWDLVTGAVWWNEGMRKLIGHAPNELGYAPSDVGASLARWYGQVDAADRDRVFGSVWAVIQTGGESWSQEYRCRWADGSCAHVSGRGYVIRDIDGKPVRMIGGITDITERKRAEEALHESEKKFRHVLDSSRDMVYCLNLKTMTYDYVSPSCRDVLGYSPEDFAAIGFMGAGALVHPDDVQRVLENFGQVRTHPTAEYRFRHKELGYRWVSDSRSVVFDDRGGSAVIGALRDITERKWAEEALEESEERFRLIARATSDVIWDWDLTTGHIWRSEGMQRLFGYAPTEEGPRVTWWYERVHPEDREKANRVNYAAISGGGESWVNEYRFQRADGSYAHVQERSYVIRDGDGRSVRLIGGMADVSERKRAEEALRDSEERFRLIAQATSDAIYDCDLMTGSVWWSEGMRTLFGYAPSDVGPGVAWWHEHIRPQDRDGVVGSTYAAIAGGEEIWSDEYRLQRADGSYAYVFDRGYFIYDRTGKPLRMIGGIADISERKRAEEELLGSEERFRLIAQATSDAIWDWDLVTGRVWRGNGMLTLFGHAPSETEPRITWWYGRIHPEDKDRVVSGLHATIQDGREFWHDEYRFRRADGSYAYVQDRGYVIRDADGRPLRIIGGRKDVTERKRAEEALRESEERFRVLFESAPDAYYLQDLEGNFIDGNEVAETITGYQREELIGKNLLKVNLLPPDEIPRAAAELAERALGTASGPIEHTLVRKDGSRIAVEISTFPARFGDQALVLGIARDVTERRRAQAALEESERRYRLLAENATDIIWTRDMNLRVTYVSPFVTRMRGYSVEEVMAQTLEETLTPASLEVARKTLAEGLAIEEMGQGDLPRWWTLELEHTCKDGSIVWLETKVAALRDEDRRMVGIMGVSRDITERRRAQTALEESERRHRLLAENATDIIWIRDLDLRGIYVNPAVTPIRGYTPEEAMAHTPEEILTPASLELAREVVAEELAKEQVEPRDLFWWRALELENICKDGSTVWLEERVTALRDEEKRIVGILGISRDISERRRAEEALQKTREELESRVEHHMRRGSAYGLTFRELTVLHLVVAGKSDKEIAATLGISVPTASKHLANILHKMGAASRTEAGVRALREGLLD